jgi:diguanylate cyclase (GGDEF)-like protein
MTAFGVSSQRLSPGPWANCAAAMGLVGLAAILRIWPLQALGSTLPWLTFCPAVIVAAGYGGPIAGSLATALACVAVTVMWPLFADGPYIRHPADWLGVSIFALAGCVISSASLTVRRAIARVEVFQTLVDSMDQGFCVVEMIYDHDARPVDYRFLQVNRAFEAQTGLRQALGRTMRGMVPDHDPHWFEIYGKVAETGEELRFENPAVAMDRYYDVFAFRIGRAQSRRVGILFNDISARKKMEQDLVLSARYDSLTGLTNSKMLNEYVAMALSRADRNNQVLGLLFIDLDKFKEVNDSFGHLAGDIVLKSVAERLLSCTRAGDLVSRLGGDEFTIVVENCRPSQLSHLTKKIIRVLEAPIKLDAGTVAISASIGIATYPEDGGDIRTLMQKADEAMYAEKKTRRMATRLPIT